MARQVGVLMHIQRFPVKSMAGENLQAVAVGFPGLSGDRVYAFRDQAKQNNFPWLTGRQLPNLVQYYPKWVKPLDLNIQYPTQAAFELYVTTPNGATYSIQDEALLNELESATQRPLSLRFSEASMQDTYPISIIGHQTILSLEKELGFSMDRRRFRMNFEIDWNEATPDFEAALIGKKLQIGSTLILEISKKDQRCIMTNIHPDTAENNPLVFKYLAEKREGCLGVYATVVKTGIVKTGDAVNLL